MSPFYTEDERQKFRVPSCEIPIEIYTFWKNLSNLNFRKKALHLHAMHVEWNFCYHNFATYGVLKGVPVSGPANLFLSRAQFGHNRSTSPTSRLNLDPSIIAHCIQNIKKQDLTPGI